MKRSSISILLVFIACIGRAAAARADLLNAAGDVQTGVASAVRHLTSAEDPNYNVSETDQDEGAVIVPAPKGASVKRRRSGRIAYGKPVAQGHFLTVVWLDFLGSICTGTLIAPKAILTAAHCLRTEDGGFIDKKNVYVRVQNQDSDYIDTYSVDLLVTAKYDSGTKYGDIALMRLTDPIVAKYVPLASTTTKLGRKVDVVGRGEVPGGDTPDGVFMYYAPVSTMMAARCATEHTSIFGNKPPTGSICFGLDKNPSTQSCGGDSGGPYFTPGTRKIQVGLVSYRPDIECGATVGNLEVGTSIPYWRTWIESQLTKYKMR